MKRLFTIILSSAICVSLWAQLPMTVVGDVYVGDAGKGGVLNSVGDIHLRAFESETPYSWARVNNSGEMKMPNVIFYTNDANDGLLMNTWANGDKVDAKNATVRKTTKNRYWYQMSLPFDVSMSTGVKDAATGRVLTLRTDFMVQFFDPQMLADSGKMSDGAHNSYWRDLAPTETIIPKGLGFRFVTNLTADTEIDFCAITDNGVSPDNIPYLFEDQEKGVSLVFKRYPDIYPHAPQTPKFTTPEGEGWNYFGGLNSTNFIVDNTGSNVSVSVGNYDETPVIYYRTGTGAADDGGWQQLVTEDEIATLRPYGVIWVQLKEPVMSFRTESEIITAQKLTFTKGSGGGFSYLKGNSLERAENAPLMRSAQAASSKDLIVLELKSTRAGAKPSKTYYRFGDGYTKSFNAASDYYTMTAQQSPSLWTVAKTDDNIDQNLFVKTLPTGENTVSLGINIASAGEYVFSLREIVNKTVKNAILYDRVQNKYTDLLKEDYKFMRTLDKNRFTVYFNRSVTSLDPLSPNTEVYAYAENDILTVKNLLPGDKVQIVDLTGRTIASGVASADAFSVTLNQKGVYIVNVRGEKTFKVLNK